MTTPITPNKRRVGSPITPTMGSGSNAYVTGKLAYVSAGGSVPGKRLHVRYIGQYTDRRGFTWDAWVPSGWALSVWIRLDHPNKARARFVYDAGDGLKRLIRQGNNPY